MAEEITTRQLRAADIPVVRRVLAQAFRELFDESENDRAIVARWDVENEVPDVDDALNHYIGNRGTFRVLCDGDEIVGMGAVRRLSDETCEMKRMWFLRAYRGRGLGRALAVELMDWARENGYKAMRLDSGPESLYRAAHSLYRKLGFTDIEPYNDNSYAKVWMEKQL